MAHYRQWIPEAVRSVRGELTLKEFAEKCGFSLTYLSDIENGRTIPTIETLDKIFIAGGTTLTLGFTKDYVPPEYLYILKSDVEKLRAILDRLNNRPD